MARGGALDDASAAWLAGLTSRIEASDGFVSLVLHGSAASGDWIAGVSDIDVIAVYEAPLGDNRPLVVSILEAAARNCPARGADIHVLTRPAVAHPEDEPSFELYVSVHGDVDGVTVRGPGRARYLLFDLESARLHGRTLSHRGQPVEVAPVPRRWLLAAAIDEVDEWLGYEYFRQPHAAVLQAARAWRLAVDGHLLSKQAAGRWAAPRWRDTALLAAALRLQEGVCEAVVDQGEARHLLAHARRLLESAGSQDLRC